MEKLSPARILGILRNHLSEKEFRESIIYWDRNAIGAGEKINAGRREIAVQNPAHLVFVDLNPKANWGHPTVYFLIDETNSNVEFFREEFPPHAGDFPDSFIVIQRYGKPPPHEKYFDVYDIDP